MIGEILLLVTAAFALFALMRDDIKWKANDYIPKGGSPHPTSWSLGTGPTYTSTRYDVENIKWPVGHTGKIDPDSGMIVEINGNPVKKVTFSPSGQRQFSYYLLYDNDRNWYFTQFDGDEVFFRNVEFSEYFESLTDFFKAMEDEEEYVLWKLGQ